MGCSLLDSGEHFKAYDVFNKAGHGVGVDDFLKKKVVQVSDIFNRERLTVMYYLKVIFFGISFASLKALNKNFRMR